MVELICAKNHKKRGIYGL